MKRFVCLMLMMFMLVGVSNAEIKANKEYELSGISASTSEQSVPNFFSGQTKETVSALLKAYRDDPSATTFNAIYDLFITSNAGYNYGTCRTSSSGYVVYTAYAESVSDFGVSLDSTGIPNCIMSLPDTSTGSQIYYALQLDPNDKLTFYRKVVTYQYVVYEELTSNYIYYYKLPNPVKQMTYDTTKDSYKWDGSSYYTQPIEPDNPNVVSVDLPGLISAITSSSVIQDNKGNRDEYFIIPFGENYYEVYFYSSILSLSQFEYFNTDRYYYDLDKTMVNDVITSIFETIKGDIGGTYFSATYNSDKDTYNISYNGRYEFNQDYMAFFSSEWNPIIYTTKDIAYYLYEKDENGEWIATADESKNIVNEVVTDSEGVEISPEVSSSDSSVAETPWERFINAIQSIPITLLDGIKKTFIPDLSYLNTTMENLKNKLGFITQARQIVDNITNSIELNPLAPPSITLDLSLANSKYDWGGKAICLDLSWYEPYKPAVDFLIICFCYGFFFWNLFRKLPDIISGVAGDAIEANYQMEVASKNSRRTPIGFNTKR